MFTLKIETDNAAFEAPGPELARILRELAKRLDTFDLSHRAITSLRDVNGNKVGEWEYTP